MENPNPPTFEESVKRLQGNDYFEAILRELALRRESAIGGLGAYETDTELRKFAAEATVLTDLVQELQGS